MTGRLERWSLVARRKVEMEGGRGGRYSRTGAKGCETFVPDLSHGLQSGTGTTRWAPSLNASFKQMVHLFFFVFKRIL